MDAEYRYACDVAVEYGGNRVTWAIDVLASSVPAAEKVAAEAARDLALARPDIEKRRLHLVEVVGVKRCDMVYFYQ